MKKFGGPREESVPASEHSK